jgi:small-conductance mechanosensitive channel
MKRVRSVLETTAQALPDRDGSHEPVVMLRDFGSSSVDWEVSVWIANPWRANLFASTMRETIWFAFKEAGITIAYPQLDVHFDPPIEQAIGGLTRVA